MNSNPVLDQWRLKGEELEDLEEAGVILSALVDGSRKLGVREAWKIIRNWRIESEKIQLYERVLGACLGINAANKPVSQHLLLLLSQPFSSAEDEIINNFLFTTPLLTATQLPLAVDWRISKLIAEGRFIPALRFGREIEGARGFITIGAETRTKMLASVREILTEGQKAEVDLEIELAMTSISKPSTSALPIIAPAAAPAWQPQAILPKSGPSSFPSLHEPTPISNKSSPIDSPHSASPFFGNTRPQFLSEDGSTQSIPLAIRETEKGKGKLPTISAEFGTPRVAEDSPARKQPTLSGFGSNRLPPTPRYNSFEGENNYDQEMDYTPSREVSPENMIPFGRRALLDPDISATLAAASSTPKRRISNVISPPMISVDKRRAVSTEVEDRPSGMIQISNAVERTIPPGAFPGQESEGEIDETPRKERAVRGGKKSAVGRVKKSAVKKSVVEKPVGTPIRRSTRLGIKERERESTAEPEEVVEVIKKSTKKKSTRSRD